jgi:uncharacterized protein
MRRHVKLGSVQGPVRAGSVRLLIAWLPFPHGDGPTVTDLRALASNAARQLPIAELHGVVCGLAVCYGDDLPLQDLVELVGVDALTDERSVASFVAASLEALEAADLRFTPLLPDDDADLALRVEALGQWCGSFLAGLAAALAGRGAGNLDDCPEEVGEIVADLTAISRIDAEALSEEADAGLDGAEADLLELREFVKVGVLLIMSVLRNEADDSVE